MPSGYNPARDTLGSAGECDRWAGSCAWRIRKAASARRPRPSTWPSALAKAGRRTLLVDLDPQCNATTGLGQQPTDSHPLVSRQPLKDSLCTTGDSRIWKCCRAAAAFRTSKCWPLARRSQAATLSQHLASGLTAYDFVLIDCPPSLGQLTQTALASSTEVLMPIQCEYFAMEGLAQMIEVIRRVMEQQPEPAAVRRHRADDV